MPDDKGDAIQSEALVILMPYLNFTSICQLKHIFVPPLDAKFIVSRKKANFGSKLRFRRV